jgi:eukaryotic-like serine/threonine-protein kinase
MSKKVGRFEILSEIQRGHASSVYKASDPDTGKMVALKTIRLAALGEQGEALLQSIQEESQACQVLNSHNIALLYGSEKIEDMLCASMEYVQGNSVATMLARNEGFSIWDLQDIARQSCQGLDHAAAHKVFHYALEPAKIMVQWDGIAKVLGYGISSTGLYATQSKGEPPQILHYMSPEQVRGDPVDARSNLFSLAAILYEMITERKAFEGEDADQVRRAILESVPTPISVINPSVHEALQAVVMKALAKSPQERYQSGQDLIVDLEKCKTSAAKAPAARKPAVANAPKPAQTSAATEMARAAAASQGGLSSSSMAAPATSTVNDWIKTQEEAAKVPVPAASSAAAPVVEDQPEVESPRFTVDPLMDESRPAEARRSSFSEINELPPLKEAYVAPEPPPPPPEEPADPVKAAVFNQAEVTKPKTPPREIAKQAVKEIKGTPPRLFLYALAAAAGVILAVVIGIAYRIHAGESDDDGLPVDTVATRATAPATPPAPAAQPAPPAPAPAKTPAQAIPRPPAEKMPVVSIRPKYNSKKLRARLIAPPRAAQPAIVPGQLSFDSNPAGALVTIDGQSQGVTPLNLTNLLPGHHTITISKSGFATEMRAVDVTSGSKSVVSIQLAPTTATVAANSDPAGAAIWVDGRNTGRVTPARISLDRSGSHSFVFKKQGYLDETVSANLQIGQTFEMAPKLRVLGETDEIKVGGRFKKVFGGSETAGMGTVSVKTQPKGAQIAVNNRLVDKGSPVEFYLNPGNYVIDITLSGFKSVEKVITVEKNGKVVIDESLDRE